MASPAAQEQLVDPVIETTYKSVNALTEGLSHHRLSMFGDPDIAKAASVGLKMRMLNEREPLESALIFVEEAQNIDRGLDLRIALYKYVQANKDLRPCLAMDKLTKAERETIMKYQVKFNETRTPLKSNKDAVIGETYAYGPYGLIDALHGNFLDLVNTSYVTELLSEDVYTQLLAKKNHWDALDALARYAEQPTRAGLRLALLKYVRSKGRATESTLTEASKEIIIDEVPPEETLNRLPSAPTALGTQSAAPKAAAMSAPTDTTGDALADRLAKLKAGGTSTKQSATMEQAVDSGASDRHVTIATPHEPSTSGSASPLPPSPPSHGRHFAVAEKCRKQAYSVGDVAARNVFDVTKGRARILVNETSVMFPEPHLGWIRFTVQLQAGPEELKFSELSLELRQPGSPKPSTTKRLSALLHPSSSMHSAMTAFRIRSIFPAPDQRWETGNAATVSRTTETSVELKVGYSDYASFTGRYTPTRSTEAAAAPYLTTSGYATNRVLIKANRGPGGELNALVPSFPFDILFERPDDGTFEIDFKLKVDDGRYRDGKWEQTNLYDGQTQRGAASTSG